jgi:hypothetical protein
MRLALGGVIVGKIDEKPPEGRRLARLAAAALGLALATALMRAGRFEHVETRTWRGIPDVAYIIGKRVNVELGRHVDIGAVESIAGVLKRWDGVTLALSGRLGAVELGVEIDIYAGGHVPVLAGILNESVNILAEPRGRVGDSVVESFYELFDVERRGMEALLEEFAAEMFSIELKAAARAGEH